MATRRRQAAGRPAVRRLHAPAVASRIRLAVLMPTTAATLVLVRLLVLRLLGVLLLRPRAAAHRAAAA